MKMILRVLDDAVSEYRDLPKGAWWLALFIVLSLVVGAYVSFFYV